MENPDGECFSDSLPFGGNEGQIFQIPPSCLPLDFRISSITIKTGTKLDQITLCYKRVKLMMMKLQWDGVNETCLSIGGTGGEMTNTLTLAPNEFVQSIYVESSTEVDKIRFTSNTGSMIEGGGNGGILRTGLVTTPHNALLVGFYGRSSLLVNQIGFLFRRTLCAGYNESECNNHGYCNRRGNGVCLCTQGWTGNSCSIFSGRANRSYNSHFVRNLILAITIPGLIFILFLLGMALFVFCRRRRYYLKQARSDGNAELSECSPSANINSNPEENKN